MIHELVIDRPSGMESPLKEIEVIPEYPSSKITLIIEEITRWMCFIALNTEL